MYSIPTDRQTDREHRRRTTTLRKTEKKKDILNEIFLTIRQFIYDISDATKYSQDRLDCMTYQ